MHELQHGTAQIMVPHGGFELVGDKLATMTVAEDDNDYSAMETIG